MKKIKIQHKTELKIKNIDGFLKKKVNPLGTGSKVDCPKEFIGREVCLVILNK